MPSPREIEDIVRTLVRHRHEHPGVRDLNGALDRRESRAGRVARDLAATVGSWTFLGLLAALVTVWLCLNLLPRFAHWDPYPFQLLALALTLVAIFALALVLMAHNRIAGR